MLHSIRFILLFHFTEINTGFNLEIQLPYKAISGSSTAEISAIGSTLTCNEQRTTIKECATDCYHRRSTQTGCPGFCADSNQSDVCHVCHVSVHSEVSGNLFTSFSSDDVLYLLTTRRFVPEVFMDFENYTSDTIYGTGTEGTIIGLAASDHITGVKGKGLYVHGGGKVRITGSGTECWTNLDHCSSGFTASIWFKPTILKESVIISTGNVNLRGFFFKARSDGRIDFFVRHRGKRLGSTTSNHVTLNQWSLLTGTYNGMDRVTGYFSGTNIYYSAQTLVSGSWLQLHSAINYSLINHQVPRKVRVIRLQPLLMVVTGEVMLGSVMMAHSTSFPWKVMWMNSRLLNPTGKCRVPHMWIQQRSDPYRRCYYEVVAWMP